MRFLVVQTVECPLQLHHLCFALDILRHLDSDPDSEENAGRQGLVALLFRQRRRFYRSPGIEPTDLRKLLLMPRSP